MVRTPAVKSGAKHLVGIGPAPARTRCSKIASPGS